MSQSRIPHSKPTTGAEEMAAVARVLESGHHARGPVTVEFERALAATVGLKFTHATSSGTTALQLALLAQGAEPGRIVLIPTLTCAAVWNAVRATGAEAVLYDGDYGVTDGGRLAAIAGAFGGEVCAVVVVAPMDEPELLSEAGGFSRDARGCATVGGVPVVLDRCQQLAPGFPSSHGGQTPQGLRAAIEVFSFYATKCISTGSGGGIATNDEGLFGRIVDMNTHDGRDEYKEARYNFQFDDLRASVGVAQLDRLNAFVVGRREVAEAYDAAFGVRLKRAERGGIVFRYLYDCGRDEGALEALQARLSTHNIEAKRPVFRPLHRYMGLADRDFPMAVRAWGRMLSLPIYPLLSMAEVERVVRIVRGG